jgi:hypothetical protein
MSKKTTKKKNGYGLIVLAFAILAHCGCSTQTTMQPRAFTDWPPGLSPAEGGKKLANNIQPSWFASRPGAHYAEDWTWMTALKFASLTKDGELKASHIKHFDPVLTSAGQTAFASVQRHVDHNIFGIVPLEIYMQT